MTSVQENQNNLENNTILKMMKKETNILKLTWILKSKNLKKMSSSNKNSLSKITMMRI